MAFIHPDIEWYTSISQAKTVAPRCPFANVHRCPRYYASLSLLGEHNLTTKLLPETERTVLAKWQASDLWPTLREEAANIQGAERQHYSFGNFCPEVSGNVFGLFAEYLAKYVDEIDKEAAEERLVAGGRALAPDWRWDWASVTALHYTECPTYSLLSIEHAPIAVAAKREELVSLRPGLFGLSIDIRKLITRLARWWLSKHA